MLKCFACESSWFCLSNNLRMKLAKTYHAFLKHKRSSFKRQFLLICYAVASFFYNARCESESFSLTFLKLRFIDCDSTQWERICWASWSFSCSVKNAMRNFKEYETKTSFIVATFSIDFLSMMSFLTRTKISFFFFSVMHLRREFIFLFRENLVVALILETKDSAASFDCRKNAFSSSSLFSSRRRDHIQITITLRVACCSCENSLLFATRWLLFKIEEFVTMFWTSWFVESMT